MRYNTAQEVPHYGKDSDIKFTGKSYSEGTG